MVGVVEATPNHISLKCGCSSKKSNQRRVVYYLRWGVENIHGVPIIMKCL